MMIMVMLSDDDDDGNGKLRSMRWYRWRRV